MMKKGILIIVMLKQKFVLAINMNGIKNGKGLDVTIGTQRARAGALSLGAVLLPADVHGSI